MIHLNKNRKDGDLKMMFVSEYEGKIYNHCYISHDTLDSYKDGRLRQWLIAYREDSIKLYKLWLGDICDFVFDAEIITNNIDETVRFLKAHPNNVTKKLLIKLRKDHTFQSNR